MMNLLKLHAKATIAMNHLDKMDDIARDISNYSEGLSVCFHSHYDEPVFSITTYNQKCTLILRGGRLIRKGGKERGQCTGVQAYLLTKEFELALSKNIQYK